MSRNKETRDKLIQERLKSILDELLRNEDNKFCADCNSKGPRWASHNLGIFMCIRCAGIHRNLGVHISKVKSVALDSWTLEQVATMKEMGNSRGRAIYEANVPDGFHRPSSNSELETLIRAKYDKKKYIAAEWTPPLTKPDISALGMDDVLLIGSGRKISKPASAGSIVLPAPAMASAASAASAVPSSKSKTSTAGGAAPAPLVTAAPAPATAPTAPVKNTNEEDLLGIGFGSDVPINADDDDDDFGSFLAAPTTTTNESQEVQLNEALQSDNNNSVDKKPASKDSIMALFGGASSNFNMSSSSLTPVSSFSGFPESVAPLQNPSIPPAQPPTASNNDLFDLDSAPNGWPNAAGSVSSQMLVPNTSQAPAPRPSGGSLLSQALPAGSFPVAANPFFNPPTSSGPGFAMGSSAAPPSSMYPTSQTQVSWSSAAQLQQQMQQQQIQQQQVQQQQMQHQQMQQNQHQQMQRHQMQQQQFLQYQFQQQHSGYGVNSGAQMSQVSSVQYRQMQQKQVHQVQQQMSSMRIGQVPSSAALPPASSSPISFLD